MELTNENIAFIRNDLLARGITLTDLHESLVDHVCCCIEQSSAPDFLAAYANAIENLGAHHISKIQHETQLLLISKKFQHMRLAYFILGFISAFATSSGVLFKLMHWPGASILLIFGVAVFNFGFLPTFFIQRYKSIAK